MKMLCCGSICTLSDFSSVHLFWCLDLYELLLLSELFHPICLNGAFVPSLDQNVKSLLFVNFLVYLAY